MEDFKYPQSRRAEVKEEIHGREIADPYRWLEEIDSEETKKWIEKQNALTEDFIEDIPFREEIKEKLEEIWNYDRYGVYIKKGGNFFFTKREAGEDQKVLYWSESPNGEPRVLLDPNELSEDGTVALTGFSVSPDGKYLAYGLSSAGSDWQTWFVKEVESGRDLDEKLEWVKFSEPAWKGESEGFFYSRYEEPEEGKEYKEKNRNQKFYYHSLGTPQEEDSLVYERPDNPEWGFEGEVTADGKYLVISVWQGTERENGVFYKNLSEPEGEVVELLSDFDASYQFVGSDDEVFYFLTDLDAPRKKVIGIDITEPDPSRREEVLPPSSKVLESVDLFGDRFVAQYIEEASHRLSIFDKEGKPVEEVGLPERGTVELFEAERDAGEFFYGFSSFARPRSIRRYDLDSRENEVCKSPSLPFDPEEFCTEQVFYSSKDGTEIPLFLCKKKDVAAEGGLPTFLYGYGGFNISLTPDFSALHLAWMGMGGLYAQANLRGGGEYGKDWHQAGRKENKQNVFDDFVAAGEWLIDNDYTPPDGLAVNGRSNGGLLIGAAMTRRPDLFEVCVPVVGVLDMLRFHEFTIGWAWVSDFGSPEDPEEFENLLSYSPLHNIEKGEEYPATLIVTGDHDDRVYPAHSFKYAARLQEAQGESAPVLLRVERKTGHGVGKPVSKQIEEKTDILTFIAGQLGLKEEDK